MHIFKMFMDYFLKTDSVTGMKKTHFTFQRVSIMFFHHNAIHTGLKIRGSSQTKHLNGKHQK